MQRSVIAEGAVAVVRLQRPDKLNALDLALERELADALRRLVRDPAVGAVVPPRTAPHTPEEVGRRPPRLTSEEPPE